MWILCGPWALLGVPGRILGSFGGSRVGLGGVQGVPRGNYPPPGGSRGGPERKGSAPRWLQGASRNRKSAFRSDSGFTLGAGIVVKIGISVIFKKSGFSFDWILGAPRGVQGGPRDVCWAPQWPHRSPYNFWGAPQQLHRGPSGKLIRSIGGLFGGSWICKRTSGLK